MGDEEGVGPMKWGFGGVPAMRLSFLSSNVCWRPSIGHCLDNAYLNGFTALRRYDETSSLSGVDQVIATCS